MATCRGVLILWSCRRGGAPKDYLYFNPFDVCGCYDPDAVMNEQSIVRRAGELNCLYVSILTLSDSNCVTERSYKIEAGKLKELEAY